MAEGLAAAQGAGEGGRNWGPGNAETHTGTLAESGDSLSTLAEGLHTADHCHLCRREKDGERERKRAGREGGREEGREEGREGEREGEKE